MKPPLDIVREACIKANPEIMELKFRCEILYDGDKFFYISGGMQGLHTIWNERSSAIHVQPNKCTTLGRPIRIGDILLTILGTFEKPNLSKGWKNLDKFMNPYIHWNLEKDSLDQQSPETIAFLAELFTNK